jgi:hypothetical protein
MSRSVSLMVFLRHYLFPIWRALSLSKIVMAFVTLVSLGVVAIVFLISGTWKEKTAIDPKRPHDHPDVYIEPKLEAASIKINPDRFQPEGVQKIILNPLVLLRKNDEMLVSNWWGEWDKRDAFLEQTKAGGESHYEVWIELEWMGMKPFPRGIPQNLEDPSTTNPFAGERSRREEDLQFLADGKSIGTGGATYISSFPSFRDFWETQRNDGQGTTGPYSAQVRGSRLMLDDLHILCSSQKVEMKIANLEIVIPEEAMVKLREFTSRALGIRKEQMAQLPPRPESEPVIRGKMKSRRSGRNEEPVVIDHLLRELDEDN